MALEDTWLDSYLSFFFIKNPTNKIKGSYKQLEAP